jgi:hypothetical protein
LQLIGTELNRDAIGAKVRCQVGDRTIVEQVIGGGSYLCASDARLVLVIPKSEVSTPRTLEIQWGENLRTEVELPATSGQGIVRGTTYYPIMP